MTRWLTLTVFLCFCCVFSVFLYCAKPSYTVDYTPTPSTHNVDEEELFNQINEYRDGLGLLTLKSDSYCQELAYEHCKYMIEKGIPSHDNFNVRHGLLFNKGASYVGENVGYGYSSMESFLYAYIKSDAHRKILENDVSTHIGISVVRDKNGRFYNTIILVKF